MKGNYAFTKKNSRTYPAIVTSYLMEKQSKLKVNLITVFYPMD